MTGNNLKELTDFLEKYNVKFKIENGIIIADDVNLRVNQLKSLPESFGNIKCNKINLSFNQLKSLPESIGNIICNNINLSCNQLTSLPESFGNIKCNSINLHNNILKSLPESIGKTKCDIIDLSRNKLTSLPKSFGNIICNRVELQGNQLRFLPESFGNIICDNIDLSYNQLKSLPKDFGNIKCNKVFLNKNKLISLPESFGNIICKVIGLQGNQLKSLPKSFGNIICNNIDLSFNKLTSLPKRTKFKSIEITKDYIYCDGILTWYKSKKTVDNYTIYKGYFSNFVVTKDNKTFAHGKSVRQCIIDIEFKHSARDSSKYKNMKLEDTLDLTQAVVMYRTITGACSGGVEQFLSSQKLKDRYSVAEIISATEGQYGHDTFKNFFMGDLEMTGNINDGLGICVRVHGSYKINALKQWFEDNFKNLEISYDYFFAGQSDKIFKFYHSLPTPKLVISDKSDLPAGFMFYINIEKFKSEADKYSDKNVKAFDFETRCLHNVYNPWSIHNMHNFQPIDKQNAECILQDFEKRFNSLQQERSVIDGINGQYVYLSDFATTEMGLFNTIISNNKKQQGAEMNIITNEKELVCTLPLPGCNKENTTISIELDIVTVTVSFKKGENFYPETIPIGLSQHNARYDFKLTKASIKDGIVTITAPIRKGILKVIKVD